MAKAYSIGEYQRFRVDNENHFEIFQFADDTVLIGDGSWNNLWSIKSLFRGFELVSKLRVNLFKSNIHFYNLHVEVVQATSCFLDCDIGTSLFMFLGIHIGVNTMCMEV